MNQSQRERQHGTGRDAVAAADGSRADPVSPDPTQVKLSRRPAAVGAVLSVAATIAAGLSIGAGLAQGPAVYESIHVDYPGAIVPVVTAAARLVADTAAVFCVGGLVVILFLLPRRGPNRDRIQRGLTLTLVRVSSLVWLLAAGASVVFEAADAGGVPLMSAVLHGLPYLIAFADLPKAWIVTVVCVDVVVIGSFAARRWHGLLVPLGAALAGVLAPIVSGQVLVGPHHDIGLDAAAIQATAATVVFGAVVVLGVRMATGSVLEVETLRRLARLVLVAIPIVVGTEVIVAGFKLAGSSLLATPTGWLIIVRLAAEITVGLIALLAWSRARKGLLSNQWLTAGFAGAGLAVATWVGAGVAMTRVPPPQYFLPQTPAQNFLGYDVNKPPSLETLIGEWRLNLLLASIAIAAVVLYTLAVRRLHRRGDSWPAGRTVAWLSGWLVVVLVTSSGLGRYSGALFSAHMGTHMALNMLVPVLLAMGGVTTLFLRATRPAQRNAAQGPHEWLATALGWPLLRIVYHPLIVFTLFVMSYYGLYLTGLFGEAMRVHWGHQLMNLHFLVVGYLFFSLVIGVDRPPKPLPHLGRLGFVLAAMPFHAFFGVIVMNTETIIAEGYYRYLYLFWNDDLLAAQEVGGGIAWAGSEIPLFLVMAALARQWARADLREARRKDRHYDTGIDDELDSYNDMLRRLNERAARGGAAEPVDGPKEAP